MAYHYTVSDLNLSGYKMTSKEVGDDTAVMGIPDNHPFKRTEAYEVVSMINKIMEYYNFQNQSYAHKIEIFIRSNLPPVLRKHEDVYDWLIYVFHGYS